MHHLFGWLQIEKVIEGSENIKDFLKEVNMEHPHGYGDVSRYTNNTIYIGRRNLDIQEKTLPSKGHGLFKHTHKDLILTEQDKTRSRWKLPDEYLFAFVIANLIQTYIAFRGYYKNKKAVEEEKSD